MNHGQEAFTNTMADSVTGDIVGPECHSGATETLLRAECCVCLEDIRVATTNANGKVGVTKEFA